MKAGDKLKTKQTCTCCTHKCTFKIAASFPQGVTVNCTCKCNWGRYDITWNCLNNEFQKA